MGRFAQHRLLNVVRREEGMRGSPDIPETHPLLTSYFAHSSEPCGQWTLGMGRGLPSLISTVLPPNPVPPQGQSL